MDKSEVKSKHFALKIKDEKVLRKPHSQKRLDRFTATKTRRKPNGNWGSEWKPMVKLQKIDLDHICQKYHGRGISEEFFYWTTYILTDDNGKSAGFGQRNFLGHRPYLTILASIHFHIIWHGKRFISERCCWYRPAAGVNSESVAGRALLWNPNGQRLPGRPRMTQMDCLRDAQNRVLCRNSCRLVDPAP